ncbi:hypothetical protein AVEN_115989-1 [Araneus ventricosus]|uniref:Uncharacterized protein n=1 Tax=Araneus ventricosus TaxID=182803 RepID=A0A4Y2EMT5_ARAVE|nr:hypothetical protein AVEN_115989-1 [Araneus ventricosus]
MISIRLVEERNQELTTKELMEFHCVSQKKVVEKSLSEEEEVTTKQQSSRAIREMLNVWETVALYIEKHRPNNIPQRPLPCIESLMSSFPSFQYSCLVVSVSFHFLSIQTSRKGLRRTLGTGTGSGVMLYPPSTCEYDNSKTRRVNW